MAVMKTRLFALIMLLAVAASLAACVSSGVIPMDHGTFMISKRSAQAGLGPPLGTKADVYKEASAYCANQSKVIETVNLDMTDSGFARPGSVSLQFRCV
jgi:hypothetical protein